MNGSIACLLIGLMVPTGLLTAAKVDGRPNIVFILSDDQGWGDYGFMGSKDIRTPHLDELAARSLVFERGYVASPLCRPSLASMVTGLFPFQHGVTGNDVNGSEDRAKLDEQVQAEFHRHPSFIRMLVANGYLAHQSGKWWEGAYKAGGFTHGMTHGDPERGGRHGDEGLTIGREGLKPIEDFIDHALAVKKPFLVWYAPFLPHTPHNPPDRLLVEYAKPGVAEDVANYRAMCEWFDETCGGLLGLLDQRGIRDNTLVVYICDNGWAAASTRADDPDQPVWKHFALRSKGSPFEMGIRTPILVSWPGKLRAGRSTDLAHAIDILPTIAAAAGVPAPADLPGVNLMDPKATSARKAVFGVTHAIHNMTPGNPDGTLQYLWCVEGDWKLIVRCHGENRTSYSKLHDWDDVPVRLYHLRDDPHESTNLAERQPDIVSRLRRLIDAWHPPTPE